MDDIKKEGLFDRPGGFPFSRDYAMDIKCKNNKCYLNSLGSCSSPAVVEIDSTGKCAPYVKYREHEAEKKK